MNTLALGILGLGGPQVILIGLLMFLALPVLVIVLIVRGLSNRGHSGPVRFCPHCGQQIPGVGVFCCFCGQRTA
ncbi:hypothetical protein SBA3_4040010 [Candidatus Sulfopaludibacter sp. SbA3]|nr:hypothetical protein SBA3_4040010 [Candidatus Sulfopaludibacter sp. SbA3]